MPRETTQHRSRDPEQPPCSSESGVVKANVKYQYHLNDKILPDVLRHGSNPVMALVPVPCCLQGCPKGGICWDVIINKDNLPSACLLQEDLIHQAMLAIVKLSNRKLRGLPVALQAYLHNPALQQWHERKESCWPTTLCAVCVISAVWLLMSLVVSGFSPDTGGALILSLPLVWIGSYLIATLASRCCIPMILKKQLDDGPPGNRRKLENNLRIALAGAEQLHRERDASRSHHLDKPTSLSGATMTFLGSPPFSVKPGLGITEIKTMPCTSSTQLNQLTLLSEVSAGSDLSPQTRRMIARFPKSGVSEVNQTSPATLGQSLSLCRN